MTLIRNIGNTKSDKSKESPTKKPNKMEMKKIDYGKVRRA